MKLVFITGLLFVNCLAVLAQSDSTKKISVDDMSKMRQNPVSGLRSVFFQEIAMPVGEGTAHSFSVQPVWPFQLGKNLKLITYTIIPIQKIPPLTAGETAQSGFGNVLFNGYFSPIKKKGNLSWGIGPSIQIPTRSNAALGSDRVCLGPSALLYYNHKNFSGGTVIQNYWSLGGEDRNKVNLMSIQYVAYYNLVKGWFVESNATILSNWLATSNNQWLVPLGGGAGKTFQIGEGKLFYCATAQMFYNAARPDIVGKWQSILQFQIIF